MIFTFLNNFSGDPYDPIQALLVAATNETIELDCVYFVLRREPDLLAKLLPSLGGCRNRDRYNRNGSDGSNRGSANNSNTTTKYNRESYFQEILCYIW